MLQTRRKRNFHFSFSFLNLADVIRDVRVNDTVICGDFNCVLNNDADIISGKKHAECTVVKFNTVLNECDLHDTWRLFNPDHREYT